MRLKGLINLCNFTATLFVYIESIFREKCTLFEKTLSIKI